MKLIPGDRYVEGGVKKLSLDEAYEVARQYGEIEIGGAFGSACAQIKLKNAGTHYICVRCRQYDTPAENLMHCVKDAERILAVL